MASFYSEKMAPARVVHLDELRSEPACALCRGPVRVIGRVKAFDASKNMVLIEYRDARLQVCVERLDKCSDLAPGTLVQFIGELQANHSDIVLDARICRDMSALNTDMFDRCLLIYRDFMSRMNLKSPSTT